VLDLLKGILIPKLDPYSFNVSHVNVDGIGNVKVCAVVESEDVAVVLDIAVVPLYRDILYEELVLI
jgi:hypothetical protein